MHEIIKCQIPVHKKTTKSTKYTDMTLELLCSRYTTYLPKVVFFIIMINPGDVFLVVPNACNAVAVFLTAAVTCIFMCHIVVTQNIIVHVSWLELEVN